MPNATLDMEMLSVTVLSG